MLDKNFRPDIVGENAVGTKGGGEGILHSVSLVVGASSSDPRLQAFSIDTSRVEPGDLLLAPLSLPAIPQDSPDDYFAQEYSMVLGERSAGALRVLDEPRIALTRYMTMGEGYLSGGAQGESDSLLEVRSCDQYMTRDRRTLCWVSYRDRGSEAFLVPNLSLLSVDGDGLSAENGGEAARYERFFDGEARVVITAGDDESSVDIFASPACGREMVDHFLLAIRGAEQASYLRHLWQCEVARFLEANGIGLFHGSLEDLVRDETITTCVSHSCGSLGVPDSLELEVMPLDAQVPLFMSIFGGRSVTGRMIFAPHEGGRWQPPRFEWLHGHPSV